MPPLFPLPPTWLRGIPVPEMHVNTIILLCVWLLLLNVMPMGLLHIVTESSSFFRLLFQIARYNLFTHAIDRHLNYLQFGSYCEQSCYKHPCKHDFWCAYELLSLGHIPVSGTWQTLRQACLALVGTVRLFIPATEFWLFHILNACHVSLYF